MQRHFGRRQTAGRGLALLYPALRRGERHLLHLGMVLGVHLQHR